jgi:hypothetical protein
VKTPEPATTPEPAVEAPAAEVMADEAAAAQSLESIDEDTGESPPATDEAPKEPTDEEVSLEAILEDLKRREGRSE